MEPRRRCRKPTRWPRFRRTRRGRLPRRTPRTTSRRRRRRRRTTASRGCAAGDRDVPGRPHRTEAFLRFRPRRFFSAARSEPAAGIGHDPVPAATPGPRDAASGEPRRDRNRFRNQRGRGSRGGGGLFTGAPTTGLLAHWDRCLSVSIPRINSCAWSRGTNSRFSSRCWKADFSANATRNGVPSN